ncbi:MAG TPA: membrane dipeptidase [Caulobacteraceae bacterium]|jgi:membrane dipeptidase|nr:membrane dipeptidase [Caulobacteraceae bacterium]
MGDQPGALDRRALISLAAAGSIGMATRAASASVRAEAADKPVIVNALGGISDPNLELPRQTPALADTDQPGVDDRSIRDALASGVSAVNITLGYVSGPMDPFEYTVGSIGAWDRLLRERADHLIKVNTAADILKARSEGKVGVFYGFQNCVQLGDKPQRVDLFANLGVRVIQLTYNPANALGDGSMAPQNRGLTPFGREVVERLNAARVMVDLSHSGERTCLDAIGASKAPISINHTGCRALTDLPRNKTDAELRGVAEKGGFVGIYFMPYLSLSGHPTPQDVVAHIDHAVNVCGEDHVGIGTDGEVSAIDDLDAYHARLAAEIAGRAAAGIGATGERADTYPFVVDLRGPDQFHKLARLLKTRGYSERRIDKILGLNFVAYARDIWG